MNELRQEIDTAVRSNPVLLFMKGTPDFPQCGFSATVAGILREIGVEYAAVNVLANSAIREEIKSYSNWPTFPQLYVKGELVGGCDIVREMHDNGELKDLLTGAVSTQ